jgi:hypothetical protein
MTRVLYIAGTGRSGSTILASILGEVGGLFAAGEMRFLWQRGLIENRLCGCGLVFRDCPVWAAALDLAAARGAAVDATGTVRLLRQTARLRHVPRMIGQRRRSHTAASSAFSAHRAAIGELYGAIAATTGSDVIVDSSKLPAYGQLLSTMPEIDLAVVHLIRDPRAAAYSWSSRKPVTDRAGWTHMEQIGPIKSSMLWDVWNLASEMLLDRGSHRYLRLHYEDLIAEPEASVRRILKLVGKEDSPLPFVDATHVLLGVNHSVAGNPERHRRGEIRLQHDVRWLSGMRPRDRYLVTAATFPLLRHYRYPARAPSAGQYGRQGRDAG